MLEITRRVLYNYIGKVRRGEKARMSKTAVKAVVKYKEKILLLQKSEKELKNDGEKNRYDLPGGRVEENESPLCAALREIHEETGLISKDITKIFEKAATKANGEKITFIYYKCKADSDEVTLSCEHTGYIWKAKDEILNDTCVPYWIKEVISIT